MCAVSSAIPSVCDGDGFCVSPEMNPCVAQGCDGKKCGDGCLSGDLRGVCNVDGDCDFDVGSVINSGQCGISYLSSKFIIL